MIKLALKIENLVKVLNESSNSDYPFKVVYLDSSIGYRFQVRGHCMRIPELYVFMHNTLNINECLLATYDGSLVIEFLVVNSK